MTAIPEAFQIALAHHQAGQLQQAEQIYRQILQANPRHAGAMHLLGLLALQQGSYDVAVQYISHAIRLEGVQAAFHANLGEAYRALGRWDEAQTCYEQALRLQPKLAEAHNNLGTLWLARGNRDAALACYQKAIAARPNFADAHNNLGTVFQGMGQWDAAIDGFRRAVEVAPDYAKGYYSLGTAYGAQGQLDPARAAFEKALALQPSHAEAHYGLALTLHKQHDWAQAEAHYQQAIRLRPDYPDAWSSLGTLYQAQGRFSEATSHYQQALRVLPTHAEAYYNWGTVLKAQQQGAEAMIQFLRAIECKPTFAAAHYNLGILLQQADRLDEAARAYEEAVRLQPDLALAHNNLGNVYKIQGKRSEAIVCFKNALRIYPEHGEAYNNLGSVLQEQGNVVESLECYRQALRFKPDCAEAHNNLGSALQAQGELSQPLACYDESLRLRPDFPEAHYNRALALLSQERFVEGWAEFAWRLKCEKYPARAFDQPLWDGAPFPHRTLLVHAEQGFGDTLHFVRYLQEVQPRGGRVILEAQPALVPLLKCSGFEDVVPAGADLPPFDLYASLFHLPGLFQTTLDNMPSTVPYLAADPQRVALWKEKLAPREGFKIGINWQGNPSYGYDHLRSIALREFAPLARVEGVRWFSLQKKFGTEQLADVADRMTIRDLGPELDEGSGAFMDTAAVMQNLDLIITSDTATAHLAGALGVPVWVALSRVPEWRWFLQREDSPWYPTMRLFRQTRFDDWPEVFARMVAELPKLIAKS